MIADSAPTEFHLHFEGDATRGHVVPATALMQAIQSIQRTVQLLAFDYEGQAPKQRFRITHDMERKYTVLFSLPQEGGYDIPYSIQSTTPGLFVPADIEAVTQKYERVLRAVNEGNQLAFRRAVPSAEIRRKITAEFKRLQPHARSGLVVSIEDANRHKLLDGHTIAERLPPLAVEATAPQIAPRLVTGRLDGLDFQEPHLKLTLPSGRQISVTYAEDFEPVLYENRRQLIQVRGEAVLRDDGSLQELNNITEILEVDDSPLLVTSFSVGASIFQARRPIEFPVEFDPETGLYTATGDFHMLVTAETRDQIESELNDALAFLWQEYVMADPYNMSMDARRLRDDLAQAFSGAVDAN